MSELSVVSMDDVATRERLSRKKALVVKLETKIIGQMAVSNVGKTTPIAPAASFAAQSHLAAHASSSSSRSSKRCVWNSSTLG